MVCAEPRLVSTVRRWPAPVEATKPITASSCRSSLIGVTPLPGPDRKLIWSVSHRMARAWRVTAMSAARWRTSETLTMSAPRAWRAKRRPARVLGEVQHPFRKGIKAQPGLAL